MFDDRYKYTQVPNPLVQPGGARSLLDFGSTTVIGEETDEGAKTHRSRSATSGGVAPKARKVQTRQKSPVGSGSTSSKKETSSTKVIAIIIAVIIGVNFLFGVLVSLGQVAEDFFYDLEQKIDRGFDSFFDDDASVVDPEIADYAVNMGWGPAYEAFESDDGAMYYYLPESDIFLGDEGEAEPVAYFRFSSGYFNLDNGKIPEPYDIYDDEYTEKTLDATVS